MYSIPQLRADRTEDQQALIDHIWSTYFKSNGNTWPQVQDVQVQFERQKVRAAMDGLPPATVYEDGQRYMIGLLGVLLTSNGETLEDLVIAYLDYLRSAYRHSLAQGAALVAVKSTDVARELDLSEEQLPPLASALHLGRLGGERGAGGGPRWAAGIPSDIADIAEAQDLRAYVHDIALRQADQLAANRGMKRTQPDQLWFVSDVALRGLLEADLEEFAKLRSVGAPKCTVILAGGILEGMLLDVLSRDAAGARTMYTKLRGKQPRALVHWDLIDLVETSWKLGIIPDIAHNLSHALRGFRNLVHPGKQLRDRMTITPEDGELAARILAHGVTAVSKYVQRVYP